MTYAPDTGRVHARYVRANLVARYRVAGIMLDAGRVYCGRYSFISEVIS
jgi:hypothetical protein